MGVVSRRWMWVESMGVDSGCGCKEEYRFPHITYPYSTCICSFLQQHPYFLFIFKNVFCLCSFMYEIIFSRSMNTHTGDYGRPTAVI